MTIGTHSGLTRVGPPLISWVCCSCIVCSPPMPVPSTTATRLGSTPEMALEAIVQASRAAKRPSWVQRSERRSSNGPRDLVAASGTQPAMRTVRSSLQSVFRARIPERPACTPSQVEEASWPRGETEPQPTIETLWAHPYRLVTVRCFGNWKYRSEVIPDGSAHHQTS